MNDSYIQQISSFFTESSTTTLIRMLDEYKKRYGEEAAYLLGKDIKNFIANSAIYTAAQNANALPASIALFAASFYSSSLAGQVTSCFALAGIVGSAAVKIVDQERIIAHINENFTLTPKQSMLLKAGNAAKKVLDTVKSTIKIPVGLLGATVGAAIGARKGEQYGQPGAGAIAGTAVGINKATKASDKVIDTTAAAPINTARKLHRAASSAASNLGGAIKRKTSNIVSKNSNDNSISDDESKSTGSAKSDNNQSPMI